MAEMAGTVPGCLGLAGLGVRDPPAADLLGRDAREVRLEIDDRRAVEHVDPAHEEPRALAPEEARSKATDLFQFASLINANYDEGQRMVLTEVLWRVVYADSKLSQHEDYLMRKLANLLDLRPGYLSEARKRVAGDARC